MKLETTARQLQSAFRLLGRAVEKRNTMPILGCVHIEGGLLRTTNLDHEVAVSIAATDANGTACVDFYRLRGLVSLVPPDAVVSIRGGKDGAEVRFPGGRYDLPTSAPEGFPDFTSSKNVEADKVSLAGSGFADAVRFVRHSISTEETRYYLNGFCVSRDLDGAPCLVATDGHRLSAAPISLQADWAQGLIIPRDVAPFIVEMPEPDSVTNLTGKLRFSWPGVTLTTRIIEGSFPDWKRVLPKLDDSSTGVTIGRTAFDLALARAQTIGGKKAGATLSFTDDAAVVAMKRPDFGTVREFLPDAAGTNGRDGAMVCFDASYMRLILRSMRGDHVRVAQGDPNGPMKVTSPGSKPWSILMPMRSDNEFALEVLHEVAPAAVGRAA